ncbi:putative mannosyl-oligosaccharide glucosidase [Helianthus annuus]|uniref:Mannosyl-oligosaccharide glucosidase n=1 Tax=Helianthus annuus TaxID=4232 RepID=A0A251RLY0_HELAN|nr:mannosyl-oligosaccharide glucosidase GCS1 [Helianthus annuus]KAF5754140.1 putative mannosyl-oligosaccharide glucosidase [Helianthus annuus]KAJ0428099.1 putative mannosyl-oligosaccharide glucosidase [Helianthus annuus]KAJ0432085.1 putative mannosyl-oligosaccharide glucosidase [Helianthus annuus]KAJ0446404.1 putative mannosyl-oligosaccharide glucosidase [Helianthus annuus]KAJ0635229.1 putative mannosyl-oligosaccharide glucosidase [Helianthus annuus]
MSGGDGRKTARNRIKPSTTTTTTTDDHRELRNRKGLRKERGKDQLRILDVNFALLGFIILTSLVALLFVFRSVQFTDADHPLPRVITPFPAPKIMDLEIFQGDHKESLYWGTYRPHVYFGVRARAPESLVAGLMWLGIKDGRYFMRHVCQDADDLQTYGWNKHNGRDYGHQVIIDHGMTLTTSFLKSKGNGSGYGGDWAVQVGVQYEKLIEGMPDAAHLFFYVADEGQNTLRLGRSVSDIDEKSLLAFGSRADVGDWEIHLKSTDDFEVHHIGLKTPHIHNLSDLVQGILGLQVRNFGHLELPDTSDDSPNIFVYQITARTPFKADIAFVTGTDIDNDKVEERVNSLTGTSLTSQLHKKENEFDDKFKKIFNPSDKLDLESVEVGKAAIGNLLGGIGYFYGQSKILFPQPSKHRSDGDSILYWPAELYTAVPSRPFFPRGFLWDEGFHQLLIWRWDTHISMDIIGHWLDLMNIDGWIPREQILGAEALSKVPEEFVVQRPSNGNPPTLFLVLQDLVCGMKRNQFSATENKEMSAFFERSFGRLEAWFQWFNTTQSGKYTSSYYWHGRKESQTIFELNPKTLSSGLDDYPRASHPTDEERHLDLRCWMLLAADCMHSISEQLRNKKESWKAYKETAELLADFDLLNKMHFDEDYGAYFDYGNHTEKVRLRRQLVEKNGNQPPSLELVREVLEQPVLRLVPHVGYVSLFPFISKIIPSKSWILEKQLDIISNTSTLWTNYGLRSLSKTSSMYMKRNTEHDPPYWRGPIWMNMNYLILSSLHHYSKEEGPYRERAETIYNELRGNLIRNVMKNYKQTGYLWEQYDQKKGNGKGAHPFTGWTSLVVLIMAESYSEC